MKKMKNLLAMILCLLMVITCAVPAYAESEVPENGEAVEAAAVQEITGSNQEAAESIQRNLEAVSESEISVKVSGMMPEDVELMVNDVPTTYALCNSSDFDTPHTVQLEITLMRGEEEWQPENGEKMTVTVDASGFENGEIVSILHTHIEEDDTVTEEDLGLYTVADGQVTFEMSRFSFIAISSTTAQFGNVSAFYPAMLTKSSSQNDQQKVLAFYYDIQGNAHMIVSYGSSSKKPQSVTINDGSEIDVNNSYESKDAKQTTALEFYSGADANSILVGKIKIDNNLNKEAGIYDINLGTEVKLTDAITVSIDFGSVGQNVEGDEYVLTLNYSIQKTVINGIEVTNDNWGDEVTGEKGAYVTYKITVTNDRTSNTTLSGTVTDQLPAGVFAESIQYSKDGSNWSDVTVTDNSIAFGNVFLSSGVSKTYYVKAQIDPNLSINEDTSYVNTATLSGDNLVPAEDTATVRVLAPTTGTLTVKKTVTKEYEKDTLPEDIFSFTLKDNEGNAVSGLNYTITKTNDTSETGTLTNDGVFHLKNGETITFTDVIAGRYTIEETLGTGSKYTCSWGENTESNEIEVTVQPQEETKAACTNTYQRQLGDLTIIKSGADLIDEGQSFIFTITGPNNFCMDVVINGDSRVTIKDLPIGKYTVTEKTGWSWRYKPENDTQEVILTAGGKNVTFENIRTEDKWLSNSSVKENQFTISGADSN